MGFVGKIPYAQKATQALKRITGLEKLSKITPRTERLLSTSLAAFPKGATVGATVTGIEAYNSGLSLEQAIPLIKRDAMVMGSVATAFNVAGFLDTQLYIKNLRKQLISASNQKLARVKQEITAMPHGPQKTRAMKGLSAVHRTDLRSIDRIVSEVEGQLIGVKAGRLYQTGQKEFDSPKVAAQKFIQGEELSRIPGGIEVLEKQLVAKQRDILTGGVIRRGGPISGQEVAKAIKAAPKPITPAPVSAIADDQARFEADIAAMEQELAQIQRQAILEARTPPKRPFAPPRAPQAPEKAIAKPAPAAKEPTVKKVPKVTVDRVGHSLNVGYETEEVLPDGRIAITRHTSQLHSHRFDPRNPAQAIKRAEEDAQSMARKLGVDTYTIDLPTGTETRKVPARAEAKPVPAAKEPPVAVEGKVKITDRIDNLEGVEKTFWKEGELTVYYDETIPKEAVNIRVQKELADRRLKDSVSKITFISTEKGTFEEPAIGLSGADLSGANLYGANLSEADLSRANLSGANLCDTLFEKTKITYRNKIVEVDFTEITEEAGRDGIV